MTLEQYMRMANVNDQEVAEIIKVERSMVTRLRLGTRKPSWPVAGRILKWSKGAVGLETWVNGK